MVLADLRLFLRQHLGLTVKIGAQPVIRGVDLFVEIRDLCQLAGGPCHEIAGGEPDVIDLHPLGQSNGEKKQKVLNGIKNIKTN